MGERTSGAGGIQVGDLLQNLRLLGLDPGPICGAVGLDHATLLLPTTRVPWRVVRAVLTAAEAARGDPLVALHAAELGSRDLLSYLATTQPTVARALEELTRFLAVSMDEVEVAWQRRPGGAAAVFTAWPEAAARQLAEYLAGVIVTDLARSTGGRFRPTAIRFPHARAGDLAEYERVLRCRVAFEQPRFEIVVSDAILTSPLDTQSPEVAAVLRAAAEQQLGFAATASIGRRVGAEVRAALARREDASPAAVAKRLAISHRTLQRRLEDEGTSFRALRDEARHERALQRLADPAATITIVADEMGFADVGAFHKAFRRWTGTSPHAYRRSVLSQG
ncbi:MAG: AraC family transcriptional regulator ligand-binding domain-containing protein [Deltaproteobacteria bacterium]|nr:AraC family transcriptional regulator ligand-binding domain-containing protein [Deltaproteobacteria bacterium]